MDRAFDTNNIDREGVDKFINLCSEVIINSLGVGLLNSQGLQVGLQNLLPFTDCLLQCNEILYHLFACTGAAETEQKHNYKHNLFFVFIETTLVQLFVNSIGLSIDILLILGECQKSYQFPHREIVSIPDLAPSLKINFGVRSLPVKMRHIINCKIRNLFTPLFCDWAIFAEPKLITVDIVSQEIRLLCANGAESMRSFLHAYFVYVPFGFATLFADSPKTSFTLMLISETKFLITEGTSIGSPPFYFYLIFKECLIPLHPSLFIIWRNLREKSTNSKSCFYSSMNDKHMEEMKKSIKNGSLLTRLQIFCSVPSAKRALTYLLCARSHKIILT